MADEISPKVSYMEFEILDACEGVIFPMQNSNHLTREDT